MSKLRSHHSLRSPISAVLLVIFLCLASTSTNALDIDVTGVARLFLNEMTDYQYRLSIVDQQVPPLFNIERILPPRRQGLAPGNFSYRFQCEPGLNADDVVIFPLVVPGSSSGSELAGW